MSDTSDLKIKIFSDGANAQEMIKANDEGIINGFTTNPTLMKKAGVTDYKSFAKEVLRHIKDKPISFEVFTDDFDSMEVQAKEIGSWGDNVYIKIPVTNTKGEPSYELVNKLSSEGYKLNVTAILTLDQVQNISNFISEATPSIVSVFAGRIADTGRDPVPHMMEAKKILHGNRNAELLWASPRELLNIIQADKCGCDIITVTNELLKKLAIVGKDLSELSLDTVKMFYNDAVSAGYKI